MLDLMHILSPGHTRPKRLRGRVAPAFAIPVLAALLLLAPPASGQEGGAVRTLGGTGEPGAVDGIKGFSQYQSPEGLAVRKDGQLFIADTGNGSVRALRLTDTRVITFARGLARPVALVFDSGTNLFVASQGDSSIRKFDFFGNPRPWHHAPLNEPGGGPITGLAIDEDDRIHVALRNGMVKRLTPAGEIEATFAQPGERDFRGVALNADGAIFVSDAAAHVIWKFTTPGAPAELFAGTPNSPGDTEGARGSGQLNQPHQIAFHGSGNLVVADRGNHRVRAINCEGVVTALYGIEPERWFDFPGPGVYPGWWDSTAEFAELRDPAGLAVDAAGNVYDSETYYHLIRKASGLTFPECGTGGVTNAPISALITPSSGIYPSGTNVTVTAANNESLGSRVRIFYTLNGFDPTTNDFPAAIINGAGVIALQGPVDLANLKVRIFNGSTPGPVVAGQPTPTSPVAVLLSPNSGFYPEGVDVRVTSAKPGGFGPGVQIFYSMDRTDPDLADFSVPIIDNIATIKFTGPIDLSVLRVRAFNNGAPGPVASGQMPILPLPGFNPVSGYFLTNTVITVTNATDPSGLFPVGTRLFFTRDGSEPNQSSPEVVITAGVARLELQGPINLANLKVRAFLGNTPGATVSGQPTSLIPPRISFGFEAPQEISSDFVAAAGQRFYAPVSLSVPPGQSIYGLQFGLTITNLSGPAPADHYHLGFESMLNRPDPEDKEVFLTIPPATYTSKLVEITNLVVGSDVVWITNVTLLFSNLVVTNARSSHLSVAWLERRGATNLYNTQEQDLIRYSIPHDTMFEGPKGKAVPGAYSFVLPAAASPGSTYRINIIRPSANSDGVREDVFIEAPDGTDPTVKVRASQTVTVGERRYVVGDLAPFRWFNAGDFGDGSILNNDLEQSHQTIIYGVNAPPPGSDFEDAIDSCCVDTNGVNRAATFKSWDGNDETINQIGFGDGRLDIADLYVNLRRSLDPSLTWYARFWSNGVLRAITVPNTFRGHGTIRQLAFNPGAVPPPPVEPGGSTEEPPSVTFRVGGIQAAPGELAAVPIYASIQGPHPIRSLLLNLKIRTIDGRAGLSENISFVAHPLLGGPQYGGGGSSDGFGAAWVDLNHPGIFGEALLGTLYVPIPREATAESAYLIHIARASASPNGINVLPATTQDGAIIMKTRPNIGWNDGIPDQWRVKYFGTLTNLRSHRLADADQDGSINAAEFALGTNPVDGNDNLRMRVLPDFDQRVRIRFRSVAGLRYKLEVSTTLRADSWQTIQSDILGTGADVEVSGGSASPQGYYRVRLQD